MVGYDSLTISGTLSARFVEHSLREEGYATASYHGAPPAREP